MFFQILWAIGCVAWNGYGLWLQSNGQKMVAPTASGPVAIFSVLFALLFWFFHSRKMKVPYIILSGLTAFLAFVAVYGGFTKNPDLWASESWRWGGIILNGIGTIAGVVAIVKAFKWISV